MSGESKAESKARTYGMFAIVVLGCALGGLSQTAVNSMMGSIGADFGVPESVAQWLTTIYMLVLGITVPAVTYLSRRFSMRTVVLAALMLCLGGAVVSFAADSFAMLLAGRVLQAVSAGITMPLSQTIAMTRFPRGQNATAMGVAGIAMGFAPNIGPTIGGAFVDSWGWHGFFVLLAAMCAVLAALGIAVIRKEPAPGNAGRLDALSLTLSTCGFGGLLLAFSNAANFPWESPLVWAPLAAGVLGLALFVVRQCRIDQPLVSMDIFASRSYTVGFVCLNTLFGSFMGITLVIPLFVTHLCGGTALESGMVFLPALIPAFLCNPLAGVLCDKVGMRPVIIGGSAFLATGSVLMMFMDASTPLWALAALQFLRAMGVSSLIGPLASWSLKDLPARIVMDGSAFSVTVRQVCASLGTALMVLVITLTASALGVASALPYQLAFGFSALLAVATAVLGVAKVR